MVFGLSNQADLHFSMGHFETNKMPIIQDWKGVDVFRNRKTEPVCGLPRLVSEVARQKTTFAGASQVLREDREHCTVKMNKSLFLCCSIIVLVVCLAAQTEGQKRKTFLEKICGKCEYCKGDPNCDGCTKCDECLSGLKKVNIGSVDYQNIFSNRFISQEGCKFCKEGEDVLECKERCNKGCNICKGKDGTGLESCKNFSRN